MDSQSAADKMQCQILLKTQFNFNRMNVYTFHLFVFCVRAVHKPIYIYMLIRSQFQFHLNALTSEKRATT